MDRIVFIGDEVSAAGFRLAGVAVRVPLEGEEQREVEQALAASELVLITEAVARRLASEFLTRCQAQARPLFGVVPDVAGATWPEDLGAQVRRKLGISEAGDRG